MNLNDANAIKLGSGDCNAFIQDANNLYCFGSGYATLTKSITGNIGLVKNGTGTVVLSGKYAGQTITVNGGVLGLNSPISNDILPSTNSIIINNTGTLSLCANNQIEDNTIVTINSGGTYDANLYSDAFGGITGSGTFRGSTAVPQIFNMPQNLTFDGKFTGSGCRIVIYSSNTLTPVGTSRTFTITNSASDATSSIPNWGIGGNDTNINNRGDVILKLGNHNAVPPAITLKINGNTTASGLGSYQNSFDMNGFNQTLAGLSLGAPLSAGTKAGIVTNNGSSDSILTLNTPSTQTFSGIIKDGPTNKISIVKDGGATQTFSGNNTYSGGTTLLGTGALNLLNSNAAGTGTIFLKSTQNLSNVTTLGLSGGITLQNPIVIDITTGRESITTSGIGNSTLNNTISISGSNNAPIYINNNNTSGLFTLNGNINGPNYTGGISLLGTLSSKNGILNGSIILPNSSSSFVIGGTTSWVINSTSNNWSFTFIGGSGDLVCGATNCIPVKIVFFNVATSTGSLDLSGYNQIIGGLASVSPTTGNGGRVVNNGSNDAVLTLSGLSTDRVFGGTITDGLTNKISLTMNSSARTQTLSGTLNYTGSTSILAGTLVRPISTATATFTNTTLTVSFSVPPIVGNTFKFFSGATTQSYPSVTLINASGRTGTYNSSNSTLTIS